MTKLKNRFLFLFALLSWLLACRPAHKQLDGGVSSNPVVAEPRLETKHLGANAKPDIVNFKGRDINLTNFLEGFPYPTPEANIHVDLRSGHLFYMKSGATVQLVMLPFDPNDQGSVDLSKGRVISASDFSKRVFWGAFWNSVGGKPVILADENNDELTGFYELDVDKQTERKLTSKGVGYIYGFSLNRSGDKVVFVSRPGKDERDPSDLRILDLRNNQESVVYRGTSTMRWGTPSWNPKNDGVIVSYMEGGLRDQHNLVYVPLQGGKPQVLTNPSVKRTSLEVLSEWLNDNVYFYTSDDGGRNSVYRASLKGKERVLISGANDNVKSASTVKDGKNLYVAVVTGNPLKSTLKLIDAASGRVTFQREFEAGWLVINGHHNNRFALSSSSFAKPFAEYEVHVSKGTAKVFERTGYPAQLLQKILHCNPSKVSFPTFDKPVVSGEKNKGMLHAFLMAPKHPREGREGRALVLSFYGGYNYHDVAFEIFCNAGYYVLSPALRGTNEFGTAFYTLGHGDWGGGETLDALSAGKWVAQRLRMAPQQIGIFGISRGGYDTMRAMTFPGSVRAQTADGSYRNVTETFRFGFGISDFGISDVISAYEEGNIAGWYVDLAGGDPRKDRPKWIDRSPITHADKLTGPLLLTHGSKDNRVPPGQSQRMYEKIKDLGKQKVVYLELPGQGHGYKGVDALSTYYRAVLKFLDELPD